jgi:hypothetical protein
MHSWDFSLSDTNLPFSRTVFLLASSTFIFCSLDFAGFLLCSASMLANRQDVKRPKASSNPTNTIMIQKVHVRSPVAKKHEHTPTEVQSQLPGEKWKGRKESMRQQPTGAKTRTKSYFQFNSEYNQPLSSIQSLFPSMSTRPPTHLPRFLSITLSRCKRFFKCFSKSSTMLSGSVV